jgi:hypothetical protein
VLGDTPELRERRAKPAPGLTPIREDLVGSYSAIDPIATLKAGVRTVRHHKLGWLQEDLLANGTLDGTKEALYKRLFANFQAQQIHIRAQKEILGEDYNPLQVMPGRDEEGRFSFTKNVDVPKNYLTQAYLLYAYDVTESTFRRLKRRNGAALEKQVPHNKNKSVLVDADYAATHYTARFFYVQYKMKVWCRDNPGGSHHRKAVERKRCRAKWLMQKEKDPGFGEVFEKKARDHAKRHKGTKEEIKDTLNRNGRRSYASLEKAINNWCSSNTILRYLKSFDDYLTYSQNVRPLWSEGNRIKQVAFSTHVRNRWGLPPETKILWTMR